MTRACRFSVPEVEPWPFSGMLDDVRYFGRQLSGADLQLLQGIGTCRCDLAAPWDCTKAP